jgi:uncharacterized membrane protein
VNSDLIVMTFDGSETARSVYRSLQVMRKSQILGLGDSVVITKDGAGSVRHEPASQGSTGLAGLLADLIFRIPGRVVPEAAKVKLDDEFVGTVRSALRNNRSALLFFVHPDSLSDTGELLNALASFRGTIHQTTLSPQDGALLRGMP